MEVQNAIKKPNLVLEFHPKYFLHPIINLGFTGGHYYQIDFFFPPLILWLCKILMNVSQIRVWMALNVLTYKLLANINVYVLLDLWEPIVSLVRFQSFYFGNIILFHCTTVHKKSVPICISQILSFSIF